jgi:aryl-alcohol dehydrogenase-like predicted oxidoreductase
MRVRRYGIRGPEVSELAFGAMSIRHDKQLSNGVSGSLLHALDRGVNLIDTARIYPESEKIIGRTLREWSGAPPFISTKLSPLDREGFRFGGPLEKFYTPAGIADSVDSSLSALGVERLDIVHMHQWHYRWTHELDWLDALSDLRREGKVGLVAVSAQDHEHDALLEIVSQGLVDGIQLIVNLFESRPCNAILPRAAQKGVGVIARCVLDSGGLAAPLTDEEFRERPFLRHAPGAEYRKRIAALNDEFGLDGSDSLVDLALRFVVSDPAVSSITLGLTSSEQVDLACQAIGKGALSDDAVGSIRRKHVWTKNFYEKLL